MKKLNLIKKKIEEAKKMDNNGNILETAIQQISSILGVNLSTTQIKELSQFVGSYIDSVPNLLELIYLNAIEMGIEKEIKPLIDPAEEYFFIEQDLIPDFLGYLGLLDDAYYFFRLIEKIDERYYKKTNNRLVPEDWHLNEANLAIKALIGNEITDILENAILQTLGGEVHQTNFNQFTNDFGSQFNVQYSQIMSQLNQMDYIQDQMYEANMVGILSQATATGIDTSGWRF